MSLNNPIPIWADLAGESFSIRSQGRLIGYDPDHPLWDEPLVDLATLGLLTKNWYAVKDGSNPPYHRRIEGAFDRVFLRQTPAQMCRNADQLVQKAGLRLLFVDGFRSKETQQGLFRHFYEIISARNAQKQNMSAEEIYREASIYASPGDINPDRPETWFVHATGGAIDVLLFDPDKQQILDCGAGFDNDTPLVFTDHFERNNPDRPARQNRRILYNAMTNAGFTNYPYEYFHYDYGTIIHAVRRKVENPDSTLRAFYGLATYPVIRPEK